MPRVGVFAFGSQVSEGSVSLPTLVCLGAASTLPFFAPRPSLDKRARVALCVGVLSAMKGLGF